MIVHHRLCFINAHDELGFLEGGENARRCTIADEFASATLNSLFDMGLGRQWLAPDLITIHVSNLHFQIGQHIHCSFPIWPSGRMRSKLHMAPVGATAVEIGLSCWFASNCLSRRHHRPLTPTMLTPVSYGGQVLVKHSSNKQLTLLIFLRLSIFVRFCNNACIVLLIAHFSWWSRCSLPFVASQRSNLKLEKSINSPYVNKMAPHGNEAELSCTYELSQV